MGENVEGYHTGRESDLVRKGYRRRMRHLQKCGTDQILVAASMESEGNSSLEEAKKRGVISFLEKRITGRTRGCRAVKKGQDA